MTKQLYTVVWCTVGLMTADVIDFLIKELINIHRIRDNMVSLRVMG